MKYVQCFGSLFYLFVLVFSVAAELPTGTLMDRLPPDLLALSRLHAPEPNVLETILETNRS